MGSIGVLGLAVLSGIAIAIQGQFMGIMTQSLGARESVFITYIGGLSLSLFSILMAQGGNLKAWQSVPWYALTSGIFGLIIVGTIGYVVPRLGLSTGFGVIVATQFVFGALIDQFGWFGADTRPLSLSTLMGFGLIVTGVFLLGR